MKAFLKLTTAQQIEFVDNSENEPFWLERMRTAIEKNAPQCVTFDKELLGVYWAIKSRETTCQEQE